MQEVVQRIKDIPAETLVWMALGMILGGNIVSGIDMFGVTGGLVAMGGIICLIPGLVLMGNEQAIEQD